MNDNSLKIGRLFPSNAFHESFSSNHIFLKLTLKTINVCYLFILSIYKKSQFSFSMLIFSSELLSKFLYPKQKLSNQINHNVYIDCLQTQYVIILVTFIHLFSRKKRKKVNICKRLFHKL